MKLIDYLKQERGRASALARALDISPVLISQWANGARQVPAERCPDIERDTSGQVACEDLRPDVNWAYLRDSSPAEPAVQAEPVMDPVMEQRGELSGDMDAGRIVPVEAA